jgi:hypothetical protein
MLDSKPWGCIRQWGGLRMRPVDRQRREEYALLMKDNTASAGKRRPNLSKYLFWDIDMRKLDYESRASFILERVFTMGIQEDEWEINKYYGKERIRKEVVKCKLLDKKTMNYLSVFYEIPKKEFACYRKDVFQKGF